MSVQQRIEIEKRMLTLMVDTALSMGYKMSVDCEGEEMLEETGEKDLILEMCLDLDICHVYYHKDGAIVGWALLVFGNDGYDLISDHTVNLNEELQPCYNLSDKIQAGEA